MEKELSDNLKLFKNIKNKFDKFKKRKEKSTNNILKNMVNIEDREK